MSSARPSDGRPEGQVLGGAELTSDGEGDVAVAVEVDPVISVAPAVVQLQVPVAVTAAEHGDGVDTVAVPVAGKPEIARR